MPCSSVEVPTEGIPTEPAILSPSAVSLYVVGMRGEAAVTAAPPGLATVRPRYGAASLSDVLPGVLTALGVSSSHDADVSIGDPLGLASGPLAEVRCVVVLLLDGFGHHLLPLAAPYAPTVADLAAGRLAGSRAQAITTGFPTSTPTSLASLGTGAVPGAHGLIGVRVRIPGTEDQVLNHLRWQDDPDPRSWQPLPTLFERAMASGVAAYAVGRPEFDSSRFTLAMFRGATYLGAADSTTLAAGILDVANRADVPTVIYGYHPDVDSAGHLHGVGSPQWADAVTQVDRLLTQVIDGLPPGSALVVTADHGQVNVPADGRFDVDTDPRLRSGVRLVVGEPRVRYLHAVPGAAEDVLATWRELLGDAAWVMPRDQAVAEGWFGPVPPAHRGRIGDVVVACHADHVILATQTEPAFVAAYVGYHGSATEAEMMVPLLVARR